MGWFRAFALVLCSNLTSTTLMGSALTGNGFRPERIGDDGHFKTIWRVVLEEGILCYIHDDIILPVCRYEHGNFPDDGSSSEEEDLL